MIDPLSSIELILAKPDEWRHRWREARHYVYDWEWIGHFIQMLLNDREELRFHMSMLRLPFPPPKMQWMGDLDEPTAAGNLQYKSLTEMFDYVKQLEHDNEDLKRRLRGIERMVKYDSTQ